MRYCPTTNTPLARALLLAALLMVAGCETRPGLELSLSLNDAAEAEPGESVLTAALSADGTLAAVTTVDGAVSVWDIAAGAKIRSWPAAEFGGGAQFLQFTERGRMLLLAGVDHSVEPSEQRQGDINYFMVRSIDDGSARRIWTLEGARLTAVAPSRDGSRILAGFSNGLIVLFDEFTSTRQDYSLHTDKITDLALSADGDRVLSSSVDGAALHWQVATGNILQRFEHKNRATIAAADSNFQVGFTSDALDNQRLWNLTDGSLAAQLQHQQRWMYISRARFSAGGNRLLIGSPSKAVSIWNPINGENIARWHIDYPVVDVAETSRGDLVSVGSSGLVEVWQRAW